MLYSRQACQASDEECLRRGGIPKHCFALVSSRFQLLSEAKHLPNDCLQTQDVLDWFRSELSLMLSVLSLIPERELSDSDVSGRNFFYLQQPWCACLCVILKEATDTNILKRPCENSIRNGAPNPKKAPLVVYTPDALNPK